MGALPQPGPPGGTASGAEAERHTVERGERTATIPEGVWPRSGWR